jgi:Tol biopolymer transport system component
METHAQLGVVPRAVVFILTVSLLGAALAASLALAGNITNADDDGGGPLAGLTYFTREGVIYQHPADGPGDPVRLVDEEERASTPRWSPDGTRFAYLSWADQDGPPTIMIRDADGSNPVVVSEQGPAPRPYFVWSPDGSRILYWADGLDVADEELSCQFQGAFCGQRIWSVASDGSDPAQVIGDPALDAIEPLWTPDGESIIFVGSAAGSGLDYGIYRMDADGANVERVGDLTGYSYSFWDPTISPDGTTLAVISGPDKYDLYLVDLATGEDVLIAGTEELDEASPLWSPDGSTIAYTRYGRAFTDESQAMLYDVASGEVISLDMALDAWGWSPDGRYIVGVGDGLTVVDVTDPMAPVATEVEGIAEVYFATWQPRT